MNLLELTPFYKLTHKNLSMSQLFLGQDTDPSAGVKEGVNTLLHTGRSGLMPLRPVPI